MDFSIIIATCGRPERLRRNLEAVAVAMRNCAGRHEIVVVDNHPAATAAAAVADFAARAGVAVRCLASKPFDKAQALNAGILATRTDWLAFTDDDTLPDPGWLREAACFAARGDYRMFGGRVVPGEPMAPLPPWLRPGPSGRVPHFGVYVDYAPLPASGSINASMPVPYGANVFVRRDVFEEFGYYDERLWALCGRGALGIEDSEFGIRVLDAGEPVGYCAEAWVLHPVHHERIRLSVLFRSVLQWGWREPMIFFKPDRPVLEGYRYRVTARLLGRAFSAAVRRDWAGATADLADITRSVAWQVGRCSRSYRVRAGFAPGYWPPSATPANARGAEVGAAAPEGREEPACGPFTCPACGASAWQACESSLLCTACGHRYPRTCHGLPWFSHDRRFYWGELDRPAMQRLLAAGGTIRDALEEQVRPCDAALADYLRGYALDGRRAAWKYLAGAAPGGRALDFGCGWGALSISLADSYREVYAADAIPERVAVALRNAREHGVANVRGCVASGWPRLPFPDGFFSLVVLNGVLEWLPAGIPGRPEAVQVAFLREVVRVLEPAGQLYVGIENRFGLPYFAGRREEHTRLRFLSLLPRPVARLYHRLRKGTEYRAYTFGLSQLERRLQRAGFAGTSAYAPFPDYRDFYLMLRLDDPRWFEHGFRPQSLPGRIASLLLRGLPPLRSLLPSLGLFASPARLPPSRLDRLVAHLKQSGAIPAELTPTSYRVSPTGTIQVKLSDGRARLLLSLPQDPGGRERMRRSVLLREALSRLASGSRLSQMLDAPVAGVQEGLYYKLDTYYDHPRAARYVRAHPWREAEVLDRSLEWLGLLHSTATSRVPFALEEFGRSGLRLALRALPGSAGAELEGWCRRAEGLPVRVSPVHGDFHLRNVLVVGDAAIARVIDWDMAELQGLPLWDVLTLWHSVRFERGEPWAAAYAAVAERVLRIRELGDAERRYADSLALTDLDCWAAVLTFPLLQLEHKAWAGQSDNHVILEGIAAPLGALARRATAALGGDAPCA